MAAPVEVAQGAVQAPLDHQNDRGNDVPEVHHAVALMVNVADLPMAGGGRENHYATVRAHDAQEEGPSGPGSGHLPLNQSTGSPGL